MLAPSATENPRSADAHTSFLRLGEVNRRWTSFRHGREPKESVFRFSPGDRLVRAIRFEAAGSIKLVQLPTPIPGPEEVLVQVLAAGVCQTDLHPLDEVKAGAREPLIPGHEIVGRVSKIGGDV